MKAAVDEVGVAQQVLATYGETSGVGDYEDSLTVEHRAAVVEGEHHRLDLFGNGYGGACTVGQCDRVFVAVDSDPLVFELPFSGEHRCVCPGCPVHLAAYGVGGKMSVGVDGYVVDRGHELVDYRRRAVGARSDLVDGHYGGERNTADPGLHRYLGGIGLHAAERYSPFVGYVGEYPRGLGYGIRHSAGEPGAAFVDARICRWRVADWCAGGVACHCSDLVVDVEAVDVAAGGTGVAGEPHRLVPLGGHSGRRHDQTAAHPYVFPGRGGHGGVAPSAGRLIYGVSALGPLELAPLAVGAHHLRGCRRPCGVRSLADFEGAVLLGSGLCHRREVRIGYVYAELGGILRDGDCHRTASPGAGRYVVAEEVAQARGAGIVDGHIDAQAFGGKALHIHRYCHGVARRQADGFQGLVKTYHRALVLAHTYILPRVRVGAGEKIGRVSGAGEPHAVTPGFATIGRGAHPQVARCKRGVPVAAVGGVFRQYGSAGGAGYTHLADVFHAIVGVGDFRVRPHVFASLPSRLVVFGLPRATQKRVRRC